MRDWMVRLALAGLAAAACGGVAGAASPDEMVDQGYEVISAEPERALKLFEAAAAAGSGKALNAIGNFWNGDSPMKRDVDKARAFYLRAEAAGYVSSTLNLGLLDWYDDDPVRQAAGCDRMEKVLGAEAAPADKRAAARAMLGQCFVYGLGRGKDIDGGLRLIEAADAEGRVDGGALRVLGHSWLAGWGSRDRDAARAFAYYRRAGEGGDEEGAWYAGMALLEGDGVKADPAAGRALIQRSAEAGYAPAQVSLAVLLATGEGGLEDDAQARLWYLSAAEQGSAHAMRSLGVMLVRGEGGAVDTVSGVALLEMAQDAGEEGVADFISEARETTVPERLKIERLKTEWLVRHGPPATDDALTGDNASWMLEPEQTPT